MSKSIKILTIASLILFICIGILNGHIFFHLGISLWDPTTVLGDMMDSLGPGALFALVIFPFVFLFIAIFDFLLVGFFFLLSFGYILLAIFGFIAMKRKSIREDFQMINYCGVGVSSIFFFVSVMNNRFLTNPFVLIRLIVIALLCYVTIHRIVLINKEKKNNADDKN